MHAFPGNALADVGTDDEQRLEMTIKERLTHLGEEMVVKEASSQLGEEDSDGNKMSPQRLKAETDNQPYLRLVNGGTELNLEIDVRVGRSIFPSHGECCK